MSGQDVTVDLSAAGSGTEPVELAGARILVTGGAGLVGSTIVDQLAAIDVAEVVVLDDFSRGPHQNLADVDLGDRLTIVEGDIRDRAAVDRAMAGIDVVFHQAAIRITQCAEDPRLAVDVLVNGAFTVFEAALRAGVRRVVAASSASVYGQAEVIPTPEEHHPWGNDTIYGAAKVFDEGMLRALHRTSGLDYVALRYFNVYGPRMDTHGVYTEVLVRWMERIDAGLAPVIHGDGSQTMDFVHVADVARANLLAAVAPVTDRSYNVGTGVSTSLLQLAEALSSVMGSAQPPEHTGGRAHVAVAHRRADIARARDELVFSSSIPLEEGLTDLVRWWHAVGKAALVP
jgi:UDP-glucose 4-epimerase